MEKYNIIGHSIFTIDYDKQVLDEKPNCESIQDIVNELLEKIHEEKSIRGYSVTRENTEVVSIITKSIIDAENDNGNNYYNLSRNIAERLLSIEIKLDEKMSHMITVKKGCLIQILLKDTQEDDKYKYLISKVESRKFVDDSDLNFKSGFTIDSDKVWKFGIFDVFVLEDELVFDTINVFVDTNAKYWPNDFLEIEEIKTDEKNTKDAFSAVNRVLKSFQKKNPADGLIIRNAVIQKFRSCSGQLNYMQMLDEIFDNYSEVNTEKDDLKNLKESLVKLPESKGFDCQFIPILSAVKARVRQKYRVNEEIEILASNGISKEIVRSQVTNEGEKELVLKLTDDQTYAMFATDNKIN